MKNSLLGRILIGTGLALLVTGVILFLHPSVLTVLVAFWITMATIEFLQLLNKAGIILNRYLLVGINLLTLIAAYLGLLPEFLIIPIAIVFITAILAQPPLPRIPVYNLFTIIYLGFLPAHLILLRQFAAENHYPSTLVLFPLILTWLSDTAAYAVGKLFGKRKLAPALSPNKTFAGSFAALLISALVSGLCGQKLVPFSSQPFWLTALLGIAISAIGQLGDLFESLFKRAVGVKDSAQTLGQHGGFLDRADSLLFAIPAFYYLTRLVTK
jgi:phosphatidate cytidylyltransferase|uniref:Phosphatidate cytidylyltransferase n=1 Tax=candidate division WOR-3 bacterium TaxID=2052148 RepID=A0A7V3PV00_UNCW3